MAGTSFSLPSELNYQLDKVAYDDRKSRSEIVQEALRLYFGKRKSEKPTEKPQQRKGA